ncbi:uncharacterized protein LOC122069762 [Macadamia integrifolia]|uniref:uncharacterized protein LOC122069762 n=1 Tax=Macadamia integrifolia TaxID=60698 RepID=UPI001C4EEA29|nr:uncharacterized protein LOC122069762 [Macadamia integrifolia]
MKEYQSLKDKNEQLKAQMVKTIKAEVKETPEEASSIQGDVSTSSSTELPLLVYNRPPLFPPFIWPPIIHPLNPMQMPVVPENASIQKDLMPFNYEPGSSNERGNLPSISGPSAPFYIIPCP